MEDICEKEDDWIVIARRQFGHLGAGRQILCKGQTLITAQAAYSVMRLLSGNKSFKLNTM